MKKIFKIIKLKDGDKRLCEVGIDLRLGDIETTIPVTNSFNSYKDLKREIEDIKRDLDSIGKEAQEYLSLESGETIVITEDMTPEQIWSVLSDIKEEDRFIKEFNLLPYDKRKDIADYVFTHCNVFSGRASLFSARYNSDNALME